MCARSHAPRISHDGAVVKMKAVAGSMEESKEVEETESEKAKEAEDLAERPVRPVWADMSTITKFDVSQFDGTGNFTMWHIRVKDILSQQGCLRTIKVDDVKPVKMDVKDLEDLKSRAPGTIRLCLNAQILYHVMDEIIPNGIWTKMETRFLDKTTSNKLSSVSKPSSTRC
jgi:hypothetical protein